jgi:hypothetical protein
MRYYSLKLSNSSGQVYAVAPTGDLYLTGPAAASSGNIQTVAVGSSGIQSVAATSTFTSHPNGKFKPPDPGALDIEFDVVAFPQQTPQGGAHIMVSGVGLKALGQSADLNGANLQLFGGMGLGIGGAAGLANPAQAGLLIQGQVLQAYGNWEGTSQVLALVVQPGNLQPPGGITFTCAPRQTIDRALSLTLAQAFGGTYLPKVNIAPLMTKYGEMQSGFYRNLTQFASWLRDYTKSLGDQTPLQSDYDGVYLTVGGNSIVASDGTVPVGAPVQLAFTDLIGQPTWIGGSQIGFKCVMRADIQVFTRVIFPQGIMTPYAITSPAAALPTVPARSRTVFQGSFIVTEAHHFANFRNPDPDAWCTAYVATPVLGT